MVQYLYMFFGPENQEEGSMQDSAVRNGLLIVVEGADKAGKETQVGLLVDSLRSSRLLGAREVRHFSFPDYDSPYGRKIAAYLRGDPEYSKMDAWEISELYARDRELKRDLLKDMLWRGDVVVLDRYVDSNAAYQGAKFPDKRARDEFQEWLYRREHEELGIPRPDLVIFLNLAEFVIARRIQEERARNGDRDIHEDNDAFMRDVRDEFRRLANKYDHWRLVEASPGGAELSRGELSERVQEVVVPYLRRSSELRA